MNLFSSYLSMHTKVEQKYFQLKNEKRNENFSINATITQNHTEQFFLIPPCVLFLTITATATENIKK